MKRINKQGIVIESGSKWEIARLIGGDNAPFKVMGFVDSHAMMRRKCCAPICVHINQFGTEYLPK